MFFFGVALFTVLRLFVLFLPRVDRARLFSCACSRAAKAASSSSVALLFRGFFAGDDIPASDASRLSSWLWLSASGFWRFLPGENELDDGVLVSGFLWSPLSARDGKVRPKLFVVTELFVVSFLVVGSVLTGEVTVGISLSLEKLSNRSRINSVIAAWVIVSFVPAQSNRC